MYGDYNSHGRQQTGFDNSIDHSTFGHWTNPEYQEMCQEVELIERENQERNNNNQEESTNNSDNSLPF